MSSSLSSFSSASASATLTSILSNITTTHSITTTSPTSTPSIPVILDSSSTSYLSSTTTSIIACLVPTLGLMYLALFSWTYQHAQMNPRPMNKTSGVRLQRYAPGAYVFLVLSGLMEVAFASWLILQYCFHANYPNTRARDGVRLLFRSCRFASSWTSLTAGAYSLLFLHPAWSRHPVSSVGAQAIWIFVTWLFWVIGAGVVNTSIPTLLDKGTCGGVVYCAQIRGLFGIAVFESLTLSAGMLVMLWLAWQSTRYALKPAVFPMH
ncbi:hypothetical protein CVT25_007279 [Psilocybe cyanescens]|uniref:MARVEL domain-containing protein n=1 Tax=Psilocybe cyanescens TaxID=93625 RepID=A0A409XPD2_PSICY|nr:hypothetical protein CVT25_007279 [Psilocybe cyanescens]